MGSPWIPVEPARDRRAILGTLPVIAGTSVQYPLPAGLVPPDACRLLAFIWARVQGPAPTAMYWHVSVTVGDALQNWFSLLVPGDPTRGSVTGGSQAFWVPMPVDQAVTVSFHAPAAVAATIEGSVEIHGYARSDDGPR
jgi:hypothetical protein